MELVTAILLVVGYGAALPVVFRMRSVFTERRTTWFAVFMGAMAAIVVAHLLAGRPVAAVINAVGAAILAFAWWKVGRRET